MTSSGWTSCQSRGIEPGFHNENFSSCCLANHICGANGVCKFMNPETYQSGFYFGGCTDPTFQDPICQPQCNQNGTAADIKFVQAPGTWACCAKTLIDNNDVRNCSEPLLDQAYEVGWAPGAFPGPVTELYTPATSTTVSASLGLSTGAKAGIGIGASLGALSLAGVGLFLFFRRRRHNSAQRNDINIAKEKTSNLEVETSKPMIQEDPSRFSGDYPRHEMSAHRQRAELES